MTWQEIYLKYKDSELMKAFFDYVCDAGNPDLGKLVAICDIQDLWGYLICFAETKGIEIDDLKTVYYDKDKLEQAMLWCAAKFFEVAK